MTNVPNVAWRVNVEFDGEVQLIVAAPPDATDDELGRLALSQARRTGQFSCREATRVRGVQL